MQEYGCSVSDACGRPCMDPQHTLLGDHPLCSHFQDLFTILYAKHFCSAARWPSGMGHLYIQMVYFIVRLVCGKAVTVQEDRVQGTLLWQLNALWGKTCYRARYHVTHCCRFFLCQRSPGQTSFFTQMLCILISIIDKFLI